jgi:hypothetical protein
MLALPGTSPDNEYWSSPRPCQNCNQTEYFAKHGVYHTFIPGLVRRPRKLDYTEKLRGDADTFKTKSMI